VLKLYFQKEETKMKNLTKVRMRKYLTMFGIDAIEAQALSEYFNLTEEINTGNEMLDAVLTTLKYGGYLTVGFATTYTTNRIIDKAFEDAEELAIFRDRDEELKKQQK
jgi:hypothetical protein